MNLPWRSPTTALLVLALAACGTGARTGEEGSSSTEEAARSPESFRPAESGKGRVFWGLVSYGHEVRSFRPCEAEEALWARDPSGLLWELHAELAPGLEPYEEVFAVVRGVSGPPPAEGFGADYPGEIHVEEVLYVAGEGFSCEFDWSRFYYRAQGNEPSWWAEVSSGGLRLGRMGDQELSWPEVGVNADRGGISFLGVGGPGGVAELALQEEPCRDSMSGAYYGFSAVLRLDDRELRGCALPGTAPVD
jgi:uncharacterized membrane protein